MDKRVLTPLESQELAEHLRCANEFSNGLSKKKRQKALVAVIALRRAVNNRGGRAKIPLSQAAWRVLQRGGAGVKFWQIFFATYDDVLSVKVQGSTSIQRAKACSREVAESWIEDDVKPEMHEINVMVDNRIVANMTGYWLNTDECGQFFNYHLSPPSKSKVAAGKGAAAKKAVNENRAQFSIQATVGLDRHLYAAHLIFKDKQELLRPAMAPQCVKDHPFLLISAAKKATQTTSTYCAYLKNIRKQLDARGLTGVATIQTDGQAARYALRTLRTCRELNLRQCISKANGTGTLQTLDQIFQLLHDKYSDVIEELIDSFGRGFYVGINEAVQAVCRIWNSWCTPLNIEKAWIKVGFDINKLTVSVDFIPGTQFMIAQQFEEPAAPEEYQMPTPEASIPRPRVLQPYASEKIRLLEAEIERLRSTQPTPTECGVLNNTADWYLAPGETQKKRKSAPTGSLEAIKYLETVEADVAIENAKRARINKEKADAAEEALQRLQIFELCKDGCMCEPGEGEQCAAKGLKQCDVCGRVLKTRCNLKACVEARELAMQQAEDASDSDDSASDSGEDDWEES